MPFDQYSSGNHHLKNLGEKDRREKEKGKDGKERKGSKHKKLQDFSIIL